MSENNICSSIVNYKEKGNTDSILPIIIKMQPMINKYARRLYLFEYEDMKQEMAIAIIEAINKIDVYENEGQVILYLCRAIKNRYYEMCRKSTLVEKEDKCDIEEKLKQEMNLEGAYLEVELACDLEKYTKGKNKIECEIIKGIIKEESDKNIAERLNVSRQYINRYKKVVFKDLYFYLKDK